MTCEIKQILAPNGQPSKLYNDILQSINDPVLAVKEYIRLKNVDEEVTLDENGEPLFSDINSNIFLSPKTKVVGNFLKLKKSKESFLKRENERLVKLRAQTRDAKTTTAKKRILKQINEAKELITEIESEIKKLDTKIDLVYLYNVLHKDDMERVSNYFIKAKADPHDFNSITEALNIIAIYKRIGNIENAFDHPIFTYDEMRSLDENQQQMLVEMGDVASGFKVELETLLRERLLNYIKTNEELKSKIGNKELDYEDLVKPLEDIDKFTRDFLNMSKTGLISGEQSILGEVMFYLMSKANEEAAVEVKNKTAKIDKLVKKVIPELNRLGYKGSKTFDLFFQKHNGKETGSLVYYKSEAYFIERSNKIGGILGSIKNKTVKLFSARKDGDLKEVARLEKLIEKDITKKDKWLRENEILFDIRRLPEVYNSLPPEIKSKVTFVNDPSHKDEIIEAVGKEQYDLLVKQQLEYINRYLVDKEINFDRIDANDKITEKGRVKDDWVKKHSPINALESFYEGKSKANNGQFYLVNIPKKYKTNVTKTATGYNFDTTNVPTGYYDANLEMIKSNPILNEFYAYMFNLLQELHASLPYDIKKQTQINTLPLFKQSYSELLLGNNLKGLAMGGTKLWDTLVNLSTDRENKTTAYEVLDPITNKVDPRFNYSVLQLSIRNKKVKDIKDRLIAKFIAKNSKKPTAEQIKEIELEAKDRVAKTGSHDIGTVLKLFTSYVTMAKHKDRILPTLNIMRKEFEAIKSKDTTNVLGADRSDIAGDTNTVSDIRENAVKQFRNQFDFFLAYPTNLVEVPINTKSKTLTPTEKKDLKEINETLTDLGYSEDVTQQDLEDELIKVQEDLLTTTSLKDRKELNAKQINIMLAISLLKQKEQLGGYITASGVGDVLLRYVQLKGMGWNVAAMPANFMAGLFSNLMQAADGRKINMSDYWYGLKQMFYSSIRTLTGSKIESGTAKKTSILMERFDILQDASNELSKASVGNLTGRFKSLNPYNLVRRVEYVNQAPLMIATLRKIKITDKNDNVSTVWNALDNEGNLKKEFRTDENIKNWEEGVGPEGIKFKLQVVELIRETHGDYSNTSRMRVKKSIIGRALTQFKTWLPEAIYVRFGREKNVNQLTGVSSKGRYRSLTPGAGAMYGAVIGSTFAPVLGTAIGFAVGRYLSPNKTEMTFGQDLLFNTKQLARKLLFKDTKFDDQFNEVDAANLRANLMELQILLGLFMMYLTLKVLLFDGDDEKDDLRRVSHNVLINQILRFQSDIQLYTSPVEAGKLVQNAMPLLKTVDQIADFIDATGRMVVGDDEIETGTNAGESRFLNSTKKLMPTIYGLQLAPDYMKERVMDESAIYKTLMEDED